MCVHCLRSLPGRACWFGWLACLRCARSRAGGGGWRRGRSAAEPAQSRSLGRGRGTPWWSSPPPGWASQRGGRTEWVVTMWSWFWSNYSAAYKFLSTFIRLQPFGSQAYKESWWIAYVENLLWGFGEYNDLQNGQRSRNTELNQIWGVFEERDADIKRPWAATTSS